MSLATVLTRAQWGVDAPLVRVEVHLGSGLPAFQLVGLPETVVRESRERVRAALQVAGFDFPAGRITVNLAPADVPKEGGRFDLPLALGLLAASGQLAADALAGTEFYGELSLEGELRPVRGLLVAAAQATGAGHRVVVPATSLPEVSCVPEAVAAGARHLRDVVQHLAGVEPLAFLRGRPPPVAAGSDAAGRTPDLADVRGQAQARRVLEVAAAGGHSLLLVGPPGAGKSLLAERLPGLLPPLEGAAALEVAVIASAAGEAVHYGRRPYRAPHHTASAIALVGGGQSPRPGEITLAHHGVLFLDELAEYSRHVLEVLREPLESGRVSIARARFRVTFPAECQLVAAMNPCPCGHAGEPGRCRCQPAEVRRYLSRLSGPFLDRLDLQVAVRRVPFADLAGKAMESSAVVARRVLEARARQARRGALNARLPAGQLEVAAPMGPGSREVLQAAAAKRQMSARACHRVLRVARTLADLAGRERLEVEDLAEALDYRQLEAVFSPG